MRTALLSVAILLSVAAADCRAWPRAPYEDEAVVGRSDLIVVAAVEAGSVQYVPHAADGPGRSWEHHATLRVGRVLKGRLAGGSLPVTFDYGLDPGTSTSRDHGATPHAVATTAPLPVVDTALGAAPVVADALHDNVWLLRRGPDGRYHATDPQDVQPLARQAYLACYLAAEPEAAVRAEVQRNPAVAADATRYLAHRDVRQIVAKPDPATRAGRLMPYVLAGASWGRRFEAGDALAACGPPAGPYVLGAFASARDPLTREDLIDLLGRTRYPGAFPVLVGLLNDGHRFWADQDLKPDWWNTAVESRPTHARRDEYGTVYAAVRALDQIGDPACRDAVEATRRQWASTDVTNRQIVDACDHAMATLGGKRD